MVRQVRTLGFSRYIAACSIMAVLCLVAGCTSAKKKAAQRQENFILVKSVKQQNLDFQVLTERKLTEVADSVDRSLAELAAIERTRTPSNKKLVAIKNARLNSQTVTIDWNGPVAPLLKKIAKLTGCRFKLLGKEPSIPVLVAVSGRDLPADDLLRSIDLQCGNRAKIVVRGSVIELRYNNL